MAKYILRLDDACPTMDKRRWMKVEELCDKYNIRPVVAVIPNNKDPKQEKDEFDSSFWQRVRNWQEKGWYIALHGYEHVYITSEGGLVPFNKHSEFAGLPYEKQAERIKKGWAVFQREDIKCNIWVAPSHTFDSNTLKAIKEHTTIKIINDRIALFPFEKYGFRWIPQQVWRFRKFPFGVWTACFHPNEMGEDEFKDLEKFIRENRESFIDLKKLNYNKTYFMNVINVIFEKLYWLMRSLKR
ncbi:MAG: DUF2334 domain-containing protein [Synergistetes bacterium]|nr:DUF2334 domain-containing protein [Synergistota bacterium]